MTMRMNKVKIKKVKKKKVKMMKTIVIMKISMIEISKKIKMINLFAKRNHLQKIMSQIHLNKKNKLVKIFNKCLIIKNFVLYTFTTMKLVNKNALI